MNHLSRARRELIRSRRNEELIPFVVSIPAAKIPAWVRPEELEATVHEAVADAVTRLAPRRVTPGQLLARKNVPPELRSNAARSMLAMRGGRATATKMRPLRFPNLVKAREALKRKRAVHSCLKSTTTRENVSAAGTYDKADSAITSTDI